MADYPSVDQHFGSSRTPDSGLVIEKADDGSVRGRSLYTATMYEFSVLHSHISSSDKSSILSHYSANDTADFNFTWAADSATYVVNYMDEPDVQPEPGGYWTVTSKLIGTAS